MKNSHLPTERLIVRRGVITYPKSLSDIRKTYPKTVRISERTFSDLGERLYTRQHLIFEKVSDFSKVNVSDITTFSFRTSKKLFGFLKSMFQILLHFGYRFGHPKSFSNLL